MNETYFLIGSWFFRASFGFTILLVMGYVFCNWLAWAQRRPIPFSGCEILFVAAMGLIITFAILFVWPVVPVVAVFGCLGYWMQRDRRITFTRSLEDLE